MSVNAEEHIILSADGFNWCLSDSKSPQISRTHLNILDDLNSAVVWMVSTRVLIPNSASHFTNPFVTAPSATITIGITVTFMFHSFFSVTDQGPGTCLSQFYSVFCRDVKVFNSEVLFFFLTLIWSSHLAEISWFVYISKSQRILWVSFSWTGSALCIN